jgi:hypothetical protein
LPRAAAVKDGRTLRPPAGHVIDGCEHGGRLVCIWDDSGGVIPAFVIDRGEIADRRVAASRIVETFDEGEHRGSRLGLCLEPAAIEQFASRVAKKLSHMALS